MEQLPGRPKVEDSNRTWQTLITLRPGACTVIDWAQAATMGNGSHSEGEGEDAHKSSDDDHSDDSDDEMDGGGGYASGTTALPPGIANDPFFARLLHNAELHDAQDKSNARSRKRRRLKSNTAEDDYDLEDPFIDDSELTFMDGHNHTKTQKRKKRRKTDDGAGTATETDVPTDNNATAIANGKGQANQNNNDMDDELDDVDRYDEDDFFVYFGPLNEAVDGSATEEDTFDAKSTKKAATSGTSKSCKKNPKTTTTSSSAPTKKKANNTVSSSSSSSSTVPAASGSSKKKPDSGKSNGIPPTATTTTTAGQVPSNGRKSGARTSRKIDHGKAQVATPSATAEVDNSKPAWTQSKPPIPERDRPQPATNSAGKINATGSFSSDVAGLTAAIPSSLSIKNQQPAARRSGTPLMFNGFTSSITVAPEDAKEYSEARTATPEIKKALEELDQATRKEAFTNRQRFPSSLKPALRQVCELSMVRALEYDRFVMSLDSPENRIFAWYTPLDMVGFTISIYQRLSEILPYNRATVRKIVSKLMSHDLITWKERQLKQLEEGLRRRIIDQIERGEGWVAVANKNVAKDGVSDDPGTISSSGGGAGGNGAGNNVPQVRWHWTTVSKHILYQYMMLTLNLNEVRNRMKQNAGSNSVGIVREQQARKDAYAHLVNLWPGTSMTTYEISRAYSSRKSLIEKQNKKAEEKTSPVKKEKTEEPVSVGSSVVTQHHQPVATAQQLSPCPQQQQQEGFKLPSPAQMLEGSDGRFATPSASPISHRNLYLGQPSDSPPQLQHGNSNDGSNSSGPYSMSVHNLTSP